LIVDDSAVARSVIGRMIEGTRRFKVAAAVGDAHAALAYLATNRVDAILLDLEMPGMDGLTALPELLAAGKGAKILVVSSSCEEGAVASIKALSLGAADTLVKPGVGNFAGRFADVLGDRLSKLVENQPSQTATIMPPIRRAAAAITRLPTSATTTSKPVATGAGDFDIVAIGASTGGIHALSQMLREITLDFQTPMLVTQHLPASFMPYFAAQLALLAGRPCVVAEDRMRIQPGQIIVAPGDGHITCVRVGNEVVIRLIDEPQPSGCMPSVDPMFASLADAYGARALAVVLSGMGRDGSLGARKLGEAGGGIIVQDQASSVVWGMPGSVAGAGIANAVLPPDEIGRVVASRRRVG
jgi:two-component system, chemotaxis family, protein-glutamate methylesterase/glutaminase